MDLPFKDWQNLTFELIREKQRHPFADYRRNRWKAGGRIFKTMFKEGNTPAQAAGLWALNHQK